jgi:predicted ester cyclase
MSTPLSNQAASLIQQFYRTADDPSQDAIALGDFIADDFKDHNRPAQVPATVSDKQALIGLFTEIKRGFPNAKHALQILAPIDADRAVVYWTFTGTHQGNFFGRAASGKTASINGVDIFRVRGAHFVEQWHVEDLLQLFAQIET